MGFKSLLLLLIDEVLDDYRLIPVKFRHHSKDLVLELLPHIVHNDLVLHVCRQGILLIDVDFRKDVI